MKKFKVFLFGIIAFILLAVTLYFTEELSNGVIINGGNVVESTIYEDYHDLGISLYHNDRLIPSDKYTYETTNNIDKDKLGEYKVYYDVKYHLRSFHVERTVKVVDNVKPVITANLTKIERDYCTKKDKKELKYEANDNYDGNITSEILLAEVDDNYLLTVKDKSGNEEDLYIPIDYGTKPSNYIKLTGGDTVYVRVNGTYKEQGAAYYDGCGNKLDDKVKIEGSVDTKKTGNYTINYSVADGTKKKLEKLWFIKRVNQLLLELVMVKLFI